MPQSRVFPQASIAEITNVSVTVQPLVTSVLVTVKGALPHALLALIPLITLADVGKVFGLQPKLPPVGVP